jgi:hypothetical protein
LKKSGDGRTAAAKDRRIRAGGAKPDMRARYFGERVSDYRIEIVVDSFAKLEVRARSNARG